jgi:hypothetical protein
VPISDTYIWCREVVRFLGMGHECFLELLDARQTNLREYRNRSHGARRTVGCRKRQRPIDTLNCTNELIILGKRRNSASNGIITQILCVRNLQTIDFLVRRSIVNCREVACSD